MTSPGVWRNGENWKTKGNSLVWATPSHGFRASIHQGRWVKKYLHTHHDTAGRVRRRMMPPRCGQRGYVHVAGWCTSSQHPACSAASGAGEAEVADDAGQLEVGGLEGRRRVHLHNALRVRAIEAVDHVVAQVSIGWHRCVKSLAIADNATYSNASMRLAWSRFHRTPGTTTASHACVMPCHETQPCCPRT